MTKSSVHRLRMGRRQPTVGDQTIKGDRRSCWSARTSIRLHLRRAEHHLLLLGHLRDRAKHHSARSEHSWFVRPQSVAAIQLRSGTGVTVSGMCFSLGKSLPSLGHLNQKGLLPRVNGCACVLQTPYSVSLAIFCDRHLSSPLLTNEASFVRGRRVRKIKK